MNSGHERKMVRSLKKIMYIKNQIAICDDYLSDGGEEMDVFNKIVLKKQFLERRLKVLRSWYGLLKSRQHETKAIMETVYPR